MGRMQLKEAQREIRQHQNKQQLRQVLVAKARAGPFGECRNRKISHLCRAWQLCDKDRCAPMCAVPRIVFAVDFRSVVHAILI